MDLESNAIDEDSIGIKSMCKAIIAKARISLGQRERVTVPRTTEHRTRNLTKCYFIIYFVYLVALFRQSSLHCLIQDGTEVESM